jgi:hypothetical protein
MEKDVFDLMADRWPSAVVARSAIRQFTGGLVAPQTLANLDCERRGPSERVVVAGKIGYPVHSLVEWLRDRSKPADQGKEAVNG